MIIQQQAPPMSSHRLPPATRARVVRILERYPRVHMWGVGQGNSSARVSLFDAREPLMTAESVSRIDQAMAWLLANTIERPTINQAHTSYGLKHIMEADTGLYVTNGQFIVAALLAGYRMEQAPGYNPRLNLQLISKGQGRTHRAPVLAME